MTAAASVATLWPVVTAGVLAGYAVALPVGPVASYLVGLAARHPWRVGAAGALGIAVVDGGYALVTGLFGTLVAGLVRPVEEPLRIASAVVLVVLAARGALAAWRQRTASGGDVPADPLTAPRAFWRFVAITAINPGTVLFFAVVVTGGALLPDAAGTGRALVAAAFGTAAFLASASWQLALALGGTLLGRVLSGRRGRLGTALASSGLMVALAVVMLLG
ncbi:LysE family translocator [Promicromonospora sp. NPDC060271]|uniref:LysE family translocator n=1 Tax=Promicromonospora sp. NPDC060271 TaxID=3347089 RepID=UPI003668F0ED